MNTIKLNIALIALSFSVMLCKGQDNNDYYPGIAQRQQVEFGGNGYFSTNFGFAEPIGEFGMNSNPVYGRYALNGSAISLTGDIPIHHSHYGISFMFGSFNNSFDIDYYVNSLQLQDQSKTYYPVSTGYYSATALMPGVFACFPIGRFSFDVRGLAGLLVGYFPAISYAAIGYNAALQESGNNSWNISSSQSAAVGYDVGAGLRYKLSRISILANCDFLYSMPKVYATEQYTDPENNIHSGTLDYKTDVTLMLYTIGVAYNIGN
jgi:hypothetical protein